MYIIQKQAQVKVFKIERAEQFEEHNIPNFTWLVKAEPDLALVPSSVLVAIYNKCNPNDPVVKFENRAKTQQRSWPFVLELAGDKPAEAKAPEPAKKPKAEPSTKEPKPKGPKKERKPGIIRTFKDMAREASGITIPEAVERLRKLFPNKAESMERTCRINLRPRYSPGERWTKAKEEKRGWVYKLRTAK